LVHGLEVWDGDVDGDPGGDPAQVRASAGRYLVHGLDGENYRQGGIDSLSPSRLTWARPQHV
jgi:hypothetical protein